MASESVRLKLDGIVTTGAAALAAKQVTSVIPIVCTAADRVGRGLVASLARPGGNVTGLSVQAPDLAGKRLELLREVVPGLRRLGILTNVDYPAAVLGRSSGRGAHARSRGRHARNPKCAEYHTRLRDAQGRRGCALCLCRPGSERPSN